ncbi:MAG: uroporphyrinogen-III synthase [Bacteroidetes bacterium]|nr:uroporphyrinogen-III synthase [Bacteroidota bacterium]
MKIKKILISQPEPSDIEKSPYGELAKKFNLKLDFRKFIKIDGIPAKEFRKDRINLLEYSAVIFTSRNAVDHYFRIAKEMRCEIPDSMKYICVSESTAYYLQKYIQYRKRKIFHSKESFDVLTELIKKHKSEKFVLPCSDIHKMEIPNILSSLKVAYKKAIIYRTLASDLSDVNICNYDLVVFFSPSGIKSLFKNFPEFKQNNCAIGVFGSSTTKAAQDAGLELTIQAPTSTAPSMTMAIEEYIVKEGKKK